jgi:hypothetical protein
MGQLPSHAMTHPTLQRLFDALAFANVGTLSEFQRALESREPLAPAAIPARQPLPSGNVVPFRREEAAAAFPNPLLPKVRLKP